MKSTVTLLCVLVAGCTIAPHERDGYEYVDGYTHGCALSSSQKHWGGQFHDAYQRGLNAGYYDCCNNRSVCTESIGHAQSWTRRPAAYEGERGRPMAKQSWLMQNPGLGERFPIVIFPARVTRPSVGEHAEE